MKSIMFSLVLLSVVFLNAQNFSFDDFIGTWNGNSYSQNTPSWNSPMTLIVESNGYYTDSSGILMPTIYPNTQQSEYDAATNRVHFWYLGTVYAGMYFYDHFFYEVTYYDGVMLQLEYNYWDDPEPHPEVQTITLYKDGGIIEGSIEGYVTDTDAGFPIEGVNILLGSYSTTTNEYGYYNLAADSGDYDLTVTIDGYYEFNDYVQIEPDEILDFNLTLQHMYNVPKMLSYELDNNNVNLHWDEPVGLNLSGYYIYRNYENIGFSPIQYFQDIDLLYGNYTYFVTAVYGDFESSPSNQVVVEIIETTNSNNDFLPVATQLSGNYPNPFNPNTNIKFSLAQDARVSIEIFNIKGEKVKSLVKGEFTAGEHSILWNGTDNSKRNVSSGMYYYKMRSGSYSSTRKMILLK